MELCGGASLAGLKRGAANKVFMMDGWMWSSPGAYDIIKGWGMLETLIQHCGRATGIIIYLYIHYRLYIRSVSTFFDIPWTIYINQVVPLPSLSLQHPKQDNSAGQF